MILKPRPFRKPRKSHWPSRGLVACSLMYEGDGNIVQDLSGNGSNGIITGATWAAGKFGPALSFTGDGANDEVDLGEPAQLRITSNLAISVWFKTPNEALNRNIVTKDNGAQRDYAIWINNNGVVEFWIFESNVYTFVRSGQDFDDDQWHHAFGFHDGNFIRLFLDGISVGTPVAATSIDDDSVDVTIGGRSGGGSDFKGEIDHVMIWNRPFVPHEAVQLFKNPFIMFDRDEIDLWAAATQGVGAPAVTVPIMTYHYKQAGGL